MGPSIWSKTHVKIIRRGFFIGFKSLVRCILTAHQWPSPSSIDLPCGLVASSFLLYICVCRVRMQLKRVFFNPLFFLLLSRISLYAKPEWICFGIHWCENDFHLHIRIKHLIWSYFEWICNLFRVLNVFLIWGCSTVFVFGYHVYNQIFLFWISNPLCPVIDSGSRAQSSMFYASPLCRDLRKVTGIFLWTFYIEFSDISFSGSKFNWCLFA